MTQPVCLFTVVYPGCEAWLPRFFQSVEQQDFKEFDLLVLNDGLSDFQQYAGDSTVSMDEIPVTGTIAEIRSRGLQMLMERPCEKVIFADADDYFSAGRIGKAVEALDHVDMYVNEVIPVDRDENIITPDYFSRRLGDEADINSAFILDKNVIGLGNTAVRQEAIRQIRIPESTIAVDWLIFTGMLLNGRTARFKNNSVTYYRQHDRNTAGFKNLTPERIERGLDVHLQNAGYFAPTSGMHRKHLEKIEELKAYLSANQKNMNRYLKKVEDILPEHPFWWEEIKPLDQISL